MVWSQIAWSKGWFRGIDWWEWPAAYKAHGGDGSYAPIGKAAEGQLSAWQR